MRLSYKLLEELVENTNKNLKKIGQSKSFKTGQSDGSFTIMCNNNYIVCSGSIKECYTFIRGVSYLANNIDKDKTELYSNISNGDRGK